MGVRRSSLGFGWEVENFECQIYTHSNSYLINFPSVLWYIQIYCAQNGRPWPQKSYVSPTMTVNFSPYFMKRRISKYLESYLVQILDKCTRIISQHTHLEIAVLEGPQWLFALYQLVLQLYVYSRQANREYWIKTWTVIIWVARSIALRSNNHSHLHGSYSFRSCWHYDCALFISNWDDSLRLFPKRF